MILYNTNTFFNDLDHYKKAMDNITKNTISISCIDMVSQKIWIILIKELNI